MLIYLLAAAMTLAMLVATAFGIRQESQHVKVRVRDDQRYPPLRSRRW